MKKENNKGVIVGLLIGIIIMLVIFIILFATNTISLTAKTNSAATNDDNQSANENEDINDGIITMDMLYGTYNWNKNYTNEAGNDINLKVILVLNADGTANYEASDGYSYESTKGTYKLENNQIVYTREYYNYPNQNNTKFEENNKVEKFDIIDKNTLKNTFNNQVTDLKKQ